MEELKGFYSTEEMEQIVTLAEALQEENMRLDAQNRILKSEIDQMKNEQQQQIQSHFSETQELISQISSMKSGIAELAQQIQKRDEKIVKLNGQIEKYAGSDLIFKENSKLKEQLQEVSISSDNKLKQARKMMDDAKKKARIADANQRDFNRHLQDKSRKIHSRVKAQWNSKMKKELSSQKTKMTVWTNAIAYSHICLMLAYLLSFDLMSDIGKWGSFIAKGISDFVYETPGIFKQSRDLFGDSLSGIILSAALSILTIVLMYGFFITILAVVAYILYTLWTDLWSEYRYNQEDQKYLAAHIYGLMSILGTIAVILRQFMPPPFNFNFVNWWIILLVLTLFVSYHVRHPQ